MIEYFFAVRDWFVVPVAGRTNESGGDGGYWGRVVGGGCSHLSSKRIAMVTRHRRHRLKGLVQRGGGWRPGLAGVPAGLILNFKEVPGGGKDTCSRGGGLSRKKISIGIFTIFGILFSSSCVVWISSGSFQAMPNGDMLGNFLSVIDYDFFFFFFFFGFFLSVYEDNCSWLKVEGL